MRRLALALCLLLGATPLAAQTVSVLVAPFDSQRNGTQELGKKIGVILNLQVWQTLVVPASGAGRNTRGTVIWDVFSSPPTGAAEAERLAADSADDPQLVLWGRGWQYGDGNVVEAFLSIRPSADPERLGFELWKVTAGERVLAVGYPHSQIEFAPIVLRADLLADLKSPAGLALYVNATGPERNGFAGDSMRALEQGREAARVVLPDGRQGWVRLPELSREHSEVIDFTGGLVRLMRQDWARARALFQKVIDNPRAPTNVRSDALLYSAAAAFHLGEDPLPWVEKAYDLDPYSKITVQYLCMAHLTRVARSAAPGAADSRARERGAESLRSLAQIVRLNRVLFPREDRWLATLDDIVREQSAELPANRVALEPNVALPSGKLR